MGDGYRVGAMVVCVSTNFPVVKKFSSTNVGAKECPKLHEHLMIDEILGDYLRFDKYDEHGMCNWWKYDRFIPLSSEQLAENKKEGEIATNLV